MVQYSSKYGWYYNDYKFDQTSRAYQYISVYYFWNYLYKLIKSANDVLKTTVDDSKKEERGQALGMRAFAYLTLVQMYQHTYSGHENDPAVPIVLETTEPDVLSNNPRASVQAVYDQIEKDLLQAHGDLAEFQRLNITYINQSVISGLLARMYLLKEDWLCDLRVYAQPFLDKAAKYIDYLSIRSEAAVAAKSGVAAMHDLSEGGVFGALWELGQCSGVGLEIDLKKIPIRQETIEICEFFDLNPYKLLSGGSLLLAAADGT